MLSNVHVLFVCLFCSDSSDSDSVEIMTPLTTPIIDFHKVISGSHDSDSVVIENHPYAP